MLGQGREFLPRKVVPPAQQRGPQQRQGRPQSNANHIGGAMAAASTPHAPRRRSGFGFGSPLLESLGWVLFLVNNEETPCAFYGLRCYLLFC
jgi:hypothetical protein